MPQIVKILSAKSAEGISIVSTSLELAACTASLAYGYDQGFPFRYLHFTQLTAVKLGTPQLSAVK